MKIFGKRKKRQEVADQNRSEAKSVIMHTYITSLMSLVLCVSMFMGTSYAWFTSEVNNDGNEINVGILDVGLYKVANGEDVELTTDAESEKLLDSGIRWEPGYTTIETIKVVNEGDLAFKYDLSFTDGSGDTDTIAPFFDVWVYDYNKNNNSYTAPNSYTEIAENSAWEKVGTLNQLLAGKPILKDKVMVTVRDENNTSGNDSLATTDTYKIAIHMNKEAQGSIMGKKITLNVKLVAYQMPSEKDAFGNSSYDNIVTDAAGLQSALSNGDAILYKDIALLNADELITMNGGTLNGNDKTITYHGGKVNDASVGVLTTSGGTITNLTINGGANGRALFMTNLASDLVVSNCTFSGAYAFNLSSATPTDNMMTFTNTTFESWSSYANVMKVASFTNCTFKDTLKPYGDTILDGCTFTGTTLDVSALEDGEKITLTNCTYQDTTIDSLEVTRTAGVLSGHEALFDVNDDGYLVWKTTQG